MTQKGITMTTKLSKQLKTARLKLNLTLRDIEKSAGGKISNPYISQLENGNVTNPSPEILRWLSRELKLDYVKLMMTAGHITKKDLQRFFLTGSGK
jgi:transcriptional regulator with XRE-family HTH domain